MESAYGNTTPEPVPGVKTMSFSKMIEIGETADPNLKGELSTLKIYGVRILANERNRRRKPGAYLRLPPGSLQAFLTHSWVVR